MLKMMNRLTSFHPQYNGNVLYSIPVYRLLLDPLSLLRKNNPDLLPTELIKDLLNSKNIKHSQEMNYKTLEKQEKYYDGYLLQEAKVFCRVMLKNIDKYDDHYKSVLLKNDLGPIFQIIEKYKSEFFQQLILIRLERFKLTRGRMVEEVIRVNTVDEIIKEVKKYGVLSKLKRALTTEINSLYGD